jgi:hypothetical protein
MAVSGVMLDENFNLLIRNNDLVLGDTTNQNKARLLLAGKGAYRLNPIIGVGLYSYLLSDNDADALQRAVVREYEQDGMTVTSLVVDVNGTLTEDISYYP